MFIIFQGGLYVSRPKITRNRMALCHYTQDGDIFINNDFLAKVIHNETTPKTFGRPVLVSETFNKAEWYPGGAVAKLFPAKKIILSSKQQALSECVT